MDDTRAGPQKCHDALIRHPTTSGRDHHWFRRSELVREFDFHLSKSRLALLREQLRDSQTRATLYLDVEVQKGAMQSIGHRATDG